MRVNAFCSLPRVARLAAAALLAAGLAACAAPGSGARQFDVDAFLGAPDMALPEVLANRDFLAATKAPVADCAAMLQSASSGVLESLGGGRAPAWLLHPAGDAARVWLVLGQADGSRSCHGPLPAAPMRVLAERARR